METHTVRTTRGVRYEGACGAFKANPGAATSSSIPSVRDSDNRARHASKTLSVVRCYTRICTTCWQTPSW